MRLLGMEIRRAEARTVVQSAAAADFYAGLGISWGNNAGDVSVTTESALSVPAVWAAVNFLASTVAGLPIGLHTKTEGATKHADDPVISAILNAAINDQTTAFAWRKHAMEQVLTTGRSFTYVEKTRAGRIVNLWPLNPLKVTVRRDDNGVVQYTYDDAGGRVVYGSSEVIDVAFMLRPDGLAHRGPIQSVRDTIGMAIAATQYSSKFFKNGGVPPFVVTGPFQSGQAMKRGGDDIADAVRKAASEGRSALVLPNGLEIKSVGADAEKSQLIETRRFLVEEVARVYSLPPAFLQDLTHGTYSNTEQQDLHLVKHTLKRWCEAFEQELTLKLFGRNSPVWAEFNMDGILRGDFKTRMEGYASGIQNAVLTPNEARRLENRPDLAGGDELMIQGATVPLGQQPMAGDMQGGQSDMTMQDAPARAADDEILTRALANWLKA